VFHGAAPASLDAVADGTIISSTMPEFLGYSVAAAGDVNGDGLADLIVGAWGPASGSGRAYAYFGTPGATFESTADGTLLGTTPSSNFGWSVASASDGNGDGFSDVLVGAPGAGSGAAYLFRGGSGSALDASSDGDLYGATSGDSFGFSVSSR